MEIVRWRAYLSFNLSWKLLYNSSWTEWITVPLDTACRAYIICFVWRWESQKFGPALSWDEVESDRIRDVGVLIDFYDAMLCLSLKIIWCPNLVQLGPISECMKLVGVAADGQLKSKAESYVDSTGWASRLNPFSFVRMDYLIPTDETTEQYVVKQALVSFLPRD